MNTSERLASSELPAPLLATNMSTSLPVIACARCAFCESEKPPPDSATPIS